MEILGYIASIIIGVSLGLIGGGGSILTVPVLVYLLHLPPVTATAYSLFIVGFTSLIGAFPKYRQGLISFKTALIFGAPSITAVFLTRKFLMPAIPDLLFSINGFIVTKPILIMLLFAMLMMAASVSMIRKKEMAKGPVNKQTQEFNYRMIIPEGVMVGVVTGLVGAGGGFLIIPALVIFSRLPMKMAVGTSLLIIAAKSLIGFLGDISAKTVEMDWKLLLTVTVMAVVGIFLGSGLSKKINGKQLQTGFGWFLLAMGIYIVIVEFHPV